jgi:hypothetical protein
MFGDLRNKSDAGSPINPLCNTVLLNRPFLLIVVPIIPGALDDTGDRPFLIIIPVVPSTLDDTGDRPLLIIVPIVPSTLDDTGDRPFLIIVPIVPSTLSDIGYSFRLFVYSKFSQPSARS